MGIKLYSTHCPKCNVLESKLKQKNIDFEIITEQAEVLRVGKENRIMSAPLLEVDGKVMDFVSANNWLNENVTADDCESCKF